MADRSPIVRPYAYAILRLVPRVERGECANVGVVLFCRPARVLGMLAGLDEARLAALWPGLDLDAIGGHLDLLRLVAAGDPGGGRIALLPQPERFGWLTAPASTIVQPGPVHGGVCADPGRTLALLFERLVSVPDGNGLNDADGARPVRAGERVR